MRVCLTKRVALVCLCHTSHRGSLQCHNASCHRLPPSLGLEIESLPIAWGGARCGPFLSWTSTQHRAVESAQGMLGIYKSVRL